MVGQVSIEGWVPDFSACQHGEPQWYWPMNIWVCTPSSLSSLVLCVYLFSIHWDYYLRVLTLLISDFGASNNNMGRKSLAAFHNLPSKFPPCPISSYWNGPNLVSAFWGIFFFCGHVNCILESVWFGIFRAEEWIEFYLHMLCSYLIEHLFVWNVYCHSFEYWLNRVYS